MPSLTPYSGKFVGYAIKEGKLSMDLNYKIKKGLMEGDNKINLDSLTLGDKIESEEATNLPLGLAIAILKDPLWSEHPVWRSIDTGDGWNDLIRDKKKSLWIPCSTCSQLWNSPLCASGMTHN